LGVDAQLLPRETAELGQDILTEIGAGHIPTVTALNKIDRLSRPEVARETVRQYSKAVAISARKGIGLPELLDLVKKELYETYTPILVRLPYQQGGLISLFHEAGQVEHIEHERGGVVMQGKIPGRLAAQFALWQATSHQSEPDEEEV
jgi:GTP-binding protein HflX